MDDSTNSRVQVVVRCRPIVHEDFQQIKKSTERSGVTPDRCINIKPDGQTVEILKRSLVCPSDVYQRIPFRVDHAFDAHATQAHIYDIAIKDMMKSYLRDGYNCACMAYGQVRYKLQCPLYLNRYY